MATENNAARSELPPERAALAKVGVGASEVAAVLGLDRYKSPFDLWAMKTGLVPDGFQPNEAAAYGHYAERTMLHWFADREKMAFSVGTPTTATRWLDALPVSLQSSQAPWAFCTPDARVFGPDLEYGVECKRRNFRMMDGWGDEGGTDVVPEAVAVQVHYSMFVTGAPAWRVIGELGGQPPVVYTLHRDAEIEDAIVSQVEEFVQRHLLGGEAPPRTGALVDEYLRKKFARSTEAVLTADAEAEAWLEDLEAVKLSLATLERAEEDLKRKLQERIGEAKTLVSTLAPGRKAMWYAVKGRETTAWKQVAIEAGASPHLIAQHTTVGDPSRTFRFYPAKEK